MAYLGPPPSQKLATPTSQYFSGNGSATAFTLNRPVNVAEDLNVFVNNVAQQPGSGKSYTATGTTLTFDAAPDAGTNNVYVVYRGLAEPTTRLEHPSGQPLAATTGTFSGDLTVDTTTLKVDSTNNRVGVGTASPTKKVSASIGLNDTDGYVLEYSADAKGGILLNPAGGEVRMGAINSSGTYFPTFYSNNSEAMRILSGGDIAFGNTVANTVSGYNNQAGGGYIASDGHFEFATTANRAPVEVGKNNANEGQLIAFRKQNTNLGTVGVSGGRIFFADQTQNTGISFYQACLLPTNINGAAVDNVYDCGHPSYRWDDIRATNGTIQTSDANEKQQIAALTAAEMTAAKSISTLFKTFKWNSAVSAKGDAARTHAGVIAQDVQAAMTAAGLDAGDYAFFISNTWWETQTEVPAVEADEENGIEAVAAYTRTDVYDTAEEAPEGATERTRMGIRYPELLSFVGAATEQRLTNVEARITALESK